MNILAAIDSFKGSLTSIEAGQAVAAGIHKFNPDIEVEISPIADGGEGTVDALSTGLGGGKCDVQVTGPLGDPVICHYGIVDLVDSSAPSSQDNSSTSSSQGNSASFTRTAIIEMAGAAGITLVPEEKRNPLHATTYGLGEVITDAYKKGCRKFIIGISGSATNDGGAGVLQALGFQLLDFNGNVIRRGVVGLKDLEYIKSPVGMSTIKNYLNTRMHQNCINFVKGDTHFLIACDVKNPLCGENGASQVFGPQKGATPEMVKDMDAWLYHYAEVVNKCLKDGSLLPPSRDFLLADSDKTAPLLADPNFPGSGAAGGLGFMFHSILGADLVPGIDLIMKEIGLEEKIKDADLVITGEGCLDSQSINGKVPVGVARLAKKYGKEVVAFAGGMKETEEFFQPYGIDRAFAVKPDDMLLEETMKKEVARKNLENAVYNYMAQR